VRPARSGNQNATDDVIRKEGRIMQTFNIRRTPASVSATSPSRDLITMEPSVLPG
jgi:hypothetical protein